MTIARSIATRLIEGIQRDLLADADVATGRWGGRAYLAPLIGDDGSITCPQIGMIYLPASFVPGVSNVSDTTVSILITLYEQFSKDPVTKGSTSAKDYVEHIQKIISKGSLTGNPNPLKPGLILDPDDVSGGTASLRWLNVTTATYKELLPVVRIDPKTQMPKMTGYAFVATFETRIDDGTRARA